MKSKKTLVLGASTKSYRYAYQAILSIVAKGNTVIAIGHDIGEVAGVCIQNTVIPLEDVDTVTLYLNSNNQKEYYDYIVSLRPKRVIFNPGTENPELYSILESHNIPFEAACTLVLLATNQF